MGYLTQTAELLILWSAMSVSLALIWIAVVFISHWLQRRWRRIVVRREMSEMKRMTLQAIAEWERHR